MSNPISNEALSIVREMVSYGHPSVVLPPHVVKEMITRIDEQNKRIIAYRVLVACHDNYLCEVDKSNDASERLYRLEAARAKLAELQE